MNQGNRGQEAKMLLLGRMFEKVDQKTGEKYYRGTLGYPITFLVKDHEAPEDNVWCLYIQERNDAGVSPFQQTSQSKPNFSTRKSFAPKRLSRKDE